LVNQTLLKSRKNKAVWLDLNAILLIKIYSEFLKLAINPFI